MTGILIAMDEESSEIKKNVKIYKTEFFANKKFYFFHFNKKKYVLVATGVGFVNASISASILCLKYKTKYIINFGTAGGVNSKSNIFDLILVDKALYFDFDLSNFGRNIGEIPNENLFFDSNKIFFNKINSILKFNKVKFKIGKICSGSTFINKKNIEKFNIIQKLDFACVDMETAAILHSCEKFNTPAISIKHISDKITSEKSEKIFSDNLKEISLRIWNLFKIIGFSKWED